MKEYEIMTNFINNFMVTTPNSKLYPLDIGRGIDECKKAVDICKEISIKVTEVNVAELTPSPLSKIVEQYYLIVRTGLLAERLLKDSYDKELDRFISSDILQPFEELKSKLKKRFSDKKYPTQYETHFVNGITEKCSPFAYIGQSRLGCPINVRIDGAKHTVIFLYSNVGPHHVGGTTINDKPYFYSQLDKEDIKLSGDIELCNVIGNNIPLIDYDKECVRLFKNQQKRKEEELEQIEKQIKEEKKKEKKEQKKLTLDMKQYFAKTNAEQLPYNIKKKILSFAAKFDLYIEIDYKGGSRVIEPIFVGHDKIEANHIRGYTKSGSHRTRSFFIDCIESLRLISRENELQQLLNKANKQLFTREGPILCEGRQITYIRDKSGKNKFVVCPADYEGCYALFEAEYFNLSMLENEGYYIINPFNTIALENPNGEQDYENDGGSSRYRFSSLRDIVIAIHLSEINNIL
jgi:hypothetical protein